MVSAEWMSDVRKIDVTGTMVGNADMVYQSKGRVEPNGSYTGDSKGHGEYSYVLYSGVTI